MPKFGPHFFNDPWIKPFITCVGILLSSSLLPSGRSLAQIIPDSTLSTTTFSSDNLNFTVEDGRRSGPNLFHSFSEFSVPTNGSVNFNHGNGVQNIIGRVTGDQISNIDGIIQANGTANLFLLNPNGFIFGPNARLELGGSFLATTAESLLFEDNIEFQTTLSSPLLSINTPLGLQLGANPGSIQVLGPGHQLIQPSGFNPLINTAFSTLGLEVGPTANLALIAGNVTLDGAVLTTAGGHIELASVRDGMVSLATPLDEPWTFSYDTDFGAIALSQSSLVDVSAATAGSVTLQGSVIDLSGGSLVLGQTSDRSDGGPINVQAREELRIRNVDSDGTRSSIRTESSGQGASGSVTIKTPSLTLRNGGLVGTAAFDKGQSGNIDIEASDRVRVVGVSPLAVPQTADLSAIIATSIDAEGNAGNINIQTRNLQIRDGGLISTSTLLGNGNGGDINIGAESIVLTGRTQQFLGVGISSASLGNGNAGDITISTGELIVNAGNIVDTSSAGSGNAGNVDITATERVIVRNSGPSILADVPRPSVISSAVNALDPTSQEVLNLPSIPTGNAGDVMIYTPDLRVTNSGMVTITSDGSGNAGNLTITSDTILLRNQGIILATTTSGSGGNVFIDTDSLRLDNGLINASSLTSGTGGDITIQSTDLVEVIGLGSAALRAQAVIPAFSGTFQPADIRQGIGSFALDRSQAGQIRINTNQLQLREGAIIASSAFDRSIGGNIEVQASDIGLTESVLSTSTFGSGRAGSVNIKTDTLAFRGGGQFLAATFGEGDAGQLDIDASERILLDGRSFRDGFFASGLSAGAQLTVSEENAPDSQPTQLGKGGDISLTTPQLTIRNGAEISASAVTTLFDQLRTTVAEATASNETNAQSLSPLSLSNPVRAESVGTEAGDIRLDVGQIILSNGQITALSQQGAGGNIDIQLDDGLVLNNLSGISTRAGGQGGGGDGGNITIDSPFLVAVGNSDIVANAFEGNGGNIQITTRGLFNLAERNQLTVNNDINASSASGVSGTVRITNLDIDPGKDTAVLPNTVVDVTQQVATACTTDDSRFVVTGQGGLPSDPDGGGDRPWANLLPDFGGRLFDERLREARFSDIPLRSDALIEQEKPVMGGDEPLMLRSNSINRLQEATNWMLASNGSVQLIAAASPSVLTAPATCTSHQY